MNRTESEESPVELLVESVSPTPSDVGSMSDSPVRAHPRQKKKKSGLSFKKIRSNAQKLMPGRKKGEKDGETEETEDPTEEGPPTSPPSATGLDELKSTESLPAINEEQPVLQGTKSIEEFPGERKAKKTRKANRAASFVKKLAGRKGKVAPNPVSSPPEDDASASTMETPLSIKRRTPEGANLNVSDTSLTESDKPSESFKIEQLEREPKLIRTIPPKKTELKITLVNKQAPAAPVGKGNFRASSAAGVQLLETSSSALASSPSPSSTSAGDSTKPASVASVGESKTVAPSSTASSSSKPIRTIAAPNVVTTAIKDNIGISSTSQIIKPENIALSDTETDNALETLEIFDNTAVKAQDQSPEKTSEKLKNFFMKKEAQKKSSTAATVVTSTTNTTKTTSVTTTSETSKKKSPKTVDPRSPGQSTVRTQEAAKPYQLGNNLKNPNLSGFKPIKPEQQQTPVEPVEAKPSTSGENRPPDAIVFDIGSEVRPNRTSSPRQSRSPQQPPPLLAPLVPIGTDSSGPPAGSSYSRSKSLDEYNSSQDGRVSLDESLLSENSRRRIAYVAQPTLFTPEEEELVSGRPSLLSSEYSADSDDFLDSKMSPHGDLLLDKNDNGASMSTTPLEKREHLYKILVIGELGTGKTSFIKRYVHQFFSQNYRATIGVDFALKVLNWDPNTIIRLQLWDIAGQERFGNMTRVYYKEAVGAFIVFDVTRSATFDAVIKWKQDLDSKVQLPDGKPIPCILLANKSDQQKQGIVTIPAKLDEYVKDHGFAAWFETSAKENINIEEAATSLVNKILMNDKQNNTGEIIDSERFALVGGPPDSSPKKNCAC
ncbi:uncharacterized protein LOC131439594 isoform X1 [Malaya genurostris]|uniref:uncharacterized protein LOC131439594 isoform X1 n=2 Tax=Malaya genurostris TaxID=325434 RepID=UPI0026F3D1DD|nr:uncharacterized protein LOC131439594 isoform X1 [Malaya genurostris]